MKVGLFALVAVFLSILDITAQAGADRQSIQGVWRVTEIRTSGSAASTNAKPQPGLFIFTERHYATIRVTASKPRPDLGEPAKASATQLLAVWGNEGFVANAGTYDVSGDTLTTRPLVAKNPDVMRDGYSITYAMTLKGNSLVLTETRDSDGPAPNPTRLTLTRIE